MEALNIIIAAAGAIAAYIACYYFFKVSGFSAWFNRDILKGDDREEK